MTARARLTALYAALFAVSSAIVLTLIFLVMRAALPKAALATFEGEGDAVVGSTTSGPSEAIDLQLYATTLGESVAADLLRWSILIMAAMLAVSVVLGWIVAGRVLAPVHAMTEQAARISAHHLSERLQLTGPHDELWQLGATLNDMIDRVQDAFDAERRLIANMSHELRTPLATQRVVLELEFGDEDRRSVEAGACVEDESGEPAEAGDEVGRRSGAPARGEARETGSRTGRDVEAMWQAGRASLAQNRRAARVVDAMLALARIDHEGVAEPVEVDLVDIVDRAVHDAAPEASGAGLTWHVALAEPSAVTGDRRLLERLVDNLVTNAVRYNEPGGGIWVATSRTADGLELRVANDGPLVPEADLDRLTMPFKRGQAERTATVTGEGLGMSIVAAIVRAHRATLHLATRTNGGLTVTVDFPQAEQLPRLGHAP